ncbi:unnamed protein product [Larinioides sclopetarius]|uniref:Uncharacterized protein n=1 Tax=Larinioides sclopetarius TaxID=280406 RepID=A0AAV1ZFE8_9ARAC
MDGRSPPLRNTGFSRTLPHACEHSVCRSS